MNKVEMCTEIMKIINNYSDEYNNARLKTFCPKDLIHILLDAIGDIEEIVYDESED
jgi:hypothetical protein